MKNFDTKYPVEGSSALQPHYGAAPARHARIIAFPEVQGASGAPRVESRIAADLRNGTVQGLSFGRMQRWQAALGGCAFAALALVGVVLGL